MNFFIRQLLPSEINFLMEMFYEAIFVPDGEKPFDKSIIHHPQLEKYTYHWGKEHDLAFIAETKREKVGLIWTRLFTRKNPGFGYFDDSTPELGMAVKPDYRNKGIGCMLLIRFFREMEKRGYKNWSFLFGPSALGGPDEPPPRRKSRKIADPSVLHALLM